MKIYQSHWWDKDCGRVLEWHASNREAVKSVNAALVEAKACGDDPPSPFGVELFNIPASKRGLIAWLNNHVTTDNG